MSSYWLYKFWIFAIRVCVCACVWEYACKHMCLGALVSCVWLIVFWKFFYDIFSITWYSEIFLLCGDIDHFHLMCWTLSSSLFNLKNSSSGKISILFISHQFLLSISFYVCSWTDMKSLGANFLFAFYFPISLFTLCTRKSCCSKSETGNSSIIWKPIQNEQSQVQHPEY